MFSDTSDLSSSSSLFTQTETPKYNLRTKSTTKLGDDHTIEQNVHVKIDEYTDINVKGLIDLFHQLIAYRKSINTKKKDPIDIDNHIEKIDKTIQDYLTELPSLSSVEETQLFISNIETNLKIRKMQFYYVILYYMINKHWPYIKKQSPSLTRIRVFFSLIKFILDNQLFEKFDDNSDGNDVIISYIITGVSYLLVTTDPRISSQSLDDFTGIISAGFKLVDTCNQSFVHFFSLLQTILSTDFVIQLYSELINYEENVSNKAIANCLQDIMIKLKRNLFLAHLPDYYCALTLYDGKVLLNNGHCGLFKEMENMAEWDWDVENDDETQIPLWSSLLIIILHEIAHGLRRIIIPKAQNLILAQTPPKNIGEKNNEAGFCLEILLFGEKMSSIGLEDGKYLLNVDNWNVVNAEIFQNKFKDFANEDIKHGKRSRLKLPSRCVPQSNYDTRIRIGHCATSKYAISHDD